MRNRSFKQKTHERLGGGGVLSIFAIIRKVYDVDTAMLETTLKYICVDSSFLKEYSMDIFMRQWWNDPRFKNNYSKPFNMAADPTKLFWTPDTYFWNVKDAKYHYVTRENMRVKISPDGEIYYSTR